MPKSGIYQISNIELQVVETALRHDKRTKERQRGMLIRLLHMEYKPEEIAKMQAVSELTVRMVHSLVGERYQGFSQQTQKWTSAESR